MSFIAWSPATSINGIKFTVFILFASNLLITCSISGYPSTVPTYAFIPESLNIYSKAGYVECDS